MFEPSQFALLTTALATSLLHTLIPDHWLPFVLIGRARRWSVGRTALISGFSGLVHTLGSLMLGGIAWLIGIGAADALGETMERASLWLLIAFGGVYAAWAWRKGGHFHPGGARVHGSEPHEACDGHEGNTHPEHLHYHADDHLIREGAGADADAWWLALIIGANPCVLVLPIMLAAVPGGAAAVGLVALFYSLPTILLMVGLAAVGVAGARRIRLPGAARHMEAASGILIAGVGVALLVIGR